MERSRGLGNRCRDIDRSLGGFTRKLHCLADALGRPLAFHLTIGEVADCKAYDALIGKVEAVIPGLSHRRVKIEHDRSLYKQRNRQSLANRFLGTVNLAAARYWFKFFHLMIYTL